MLLPKKVTAHTMRGARPNGTAGNAITVTHSRTTSTGGQQDMAMIAARSVVRLPSRRSARRGDRQSELEGRGRHKKKPKTQWPEPQAHQAPAPAPAAVRTEGNGDSTTRMNVAESCRPCTIVTPRHETIDAHTPHGTANRPNDVAADFRVGGPSSTSP